MRATSTFTLEHLDRMSDHHGLFEHAAGTTRREEHGYCVDDNARLLLITSRQPDVGVNRRLCRSALAFVIAAQDADGRFRNRMDSSGRWTDRASTDDCWGRSLWALGSAASDHSDPAVRHEAQRAFDSGARRRSPWTRSMAFAALGAADVLNRNANHEGARALLVDALDVVGTLDTVGTTAAWRWPEPRLRYANATLAEAVIAAGAALDRPKDFESGLTMLAWLLELETARGHLSVTGAGGRRPHDRGPQFDQQPIEVAAMADACWRAYALTGDDTWARGVAAAAAWFAGDNDTNAVMFDEVSGGGFDGLQRVGVNLNQGAESTLALISTMQRARSLAPAR